MKPTPPFNSLTQQIKKNRFAKMEVKKHRRLSLKERVIIQILLEEKKNKVDIAKILNRTRYTISREVNKLVPNPGDKYDADLSHWAAKDDYANKRNLDKINQHSLLSIFSIKDYYLIGLRNKFLEDLNNCILMIV